MPLWWRKSSNESNKKSGRQSIIDWHRKCIRPGTSRKCTSDTSQSGKDSRSLPPSIQVSCSPSFGERPQAQPLPLPGYRTNYGNIVSTESPIGDNFKNALFPLHSRTGRVKISKHGVNGENDLASDSSGSSSDTDDPSNSCILSPQTSDYENGIQSAIASPGVKQVDQFLYANKKNSRQMLTPKNVLSVPASPKMRPLSAPDSSMSSPSRSPMNFLGQDPVVNTSFWLGSGQCSSPGSCSTSVAGDIPSQLLWPHGRYSPEGSLLPSPRITSPCPSSRMRSGIATPLHPRVGGPLNESPGARPNDGKQKSHPLPLPPVTIPTSFSPSFVSGSSPGIQRSPDNPPSPGSPWKKGRLLGRGTFGQVYIGFNSESGEMCAMKEVTLFSDDARSKESALQLGQEIALLSRLRHPNIVQYFGSATFDDKLYIYLEYVSGGSIHKILQEYGQLGEAAIRSYTQQILSGLSYLHAKNTLHRDIKGANILVDPSGRVKLADFGMAKHITGHSCPLSLKGSPYWMAPEVIKNSGTCNFAVDIWSLGCTVYEMATTKPPWSQYEGVAAMFKIGNSKELPEIPDNLSDESKDFVRLCLQRNPSKRPTAAQLLEHPFVKSTASLERPILNSEPKARPGTLRSVRSLGFEHSRPPTNVNSPRAVNLPRSPKAAPGFSETYVARNISSPISPTESRLPHSQSLSQHINGRLSPSLILSPLATSGYSTPRGGNYALPLYRHPQPPPNYLKETEGMIGSFQKNLNLNTREQKRSDAFRGIVQAHLSRETVSCGNARNEVELAMLQEKRYDAHLILADRVSRQLLINPLRLNPEVDINPNCPTPTRNI